MRFIIPALLCSFLCGGLASSVAGGDWTFSIGPESRLGMKVEATGSSYVQAQGISSARTGRMFTQARDGSPAYRYAAIPQDASGYANRQFDDGFVNMDAGTAFPDTSVPGMTWFWGYDNPSQYDAGSQSLSFHRDTTGFDSQSVMDVQQGRDVSRQILRNESLHETDEQNAYGLGMAVGRSLMTKPDMSLDMRGGFGVLWGSESHLHSSTYGERIHEEVYRIEDQSTYSDQHQYRDTYTYDTTGIVPPPAPYAGTLDGPGPVIANIPESSHRDVLGSSRQVANSRAAILAGSSDWTAANDIDFAVNSSLYDAWLGPRLCFLPHRTISVVADARVSLNYADVTVNRHETFATSSDPGSEQILQSWDNEASKSKWILGYGVSLGVDVKVTENWSVSLLGGYDWMSDDIAVAVGPSTISLDPSGYSLGAQVVRSF